MNKQKIADAVTAVLTGELYVGQRVKVKESFGGTFKRQKTIIVEIRGGSFVRVEPKINSDGVWNRSWFEPDYD